MKLSKTTQWIITIGILAILLVGAGVVYGRQKLGQGQLMAMVAKAQQDFATYTEKKKEMEARLSQANYRIASVQSEFRQYTESIEINEALFEAADDAGVTITTLGSPMPENEELKGITYRAFSVSITAEGDVVPALLNFSDKLSQTFSAANIESVGINVPKTEEESKATISLRLRIYAYGS